MQSKKVLFVDEKEYRFLFYYESKEWWIKRNIIPHFKAYENKIDKWLTYAWVLINRPFAVVFVQLSLKNIILTKLCNFIGVKTIFWQHGVFEYDMNIIKKYRKIGAFLTTLITFSLFDQNNIKQYFKRVGNAFIIPHYETNAIKSSKKIENSILYIGQIITSEQIRKSSAIMAEDSDCERLLNQIWEYLSTTSYKVYLKKHPGDKSSYLEKLTNKYKNFQMVYGHIIPTIVLGHFSTLIIPYLQIGIPFVQVEYILNNKVNFDYYKPYNYNTQVNIKIPNDISGIQKYMNLKYRPQINNQNFKSISETILKVIWPE